MRIETLLLEGFTATALSRVIEIIRGSIAGRLDGADFQVCSALATGHRAFVLKGWLEKKTGPAVRFRAKWGELAAGEVMFQPHPGQPWEDAEVRHIDLELSGKRLKLSLGFCTEAGCEHTAVFRAEA